MTGLFVGRLQRLSALVVLSYGLYLVLVPIFHFPFDINNIAHQIMLTILFIALVIHTRIGIWAVVTDYLPTSIQGFSLRIIELYIVLVTIWGLLIVW